MENKKKNDNHFMKYAGLAFQLLGATGIGVLIGKWADKKLKNQTPYMTALFAIVFLGGAMYSIIKDLLKTNRD